MIATDITAYLAANGHGSTGSNLFTDDMPDAPDSVVVIYEYPGASGFYTRDSPYPVLERPRIQLTVRGMAYGAVSTKAEACHAELLGITNVVANGVHYGHVRHLQDGWLKNRDERNRHVWQRNYEVFREAVTAGI